MQIRIGNKQDEVAVRAFVATQTERLGLGLPDFSGEFADLKNIVSNYIGHDGIFLIAEEENKVVGFAAARSKSDTACIVERIFVDREWIERGLLKQLVDKIIDFARGLDYHQLEVHCQAPYVESLLESLQFTRSSDAHRLLFLRSL